MRMIKKGKRSNARKCKVRHDTRVKKLQIKTGNSKLKSKTVSMGQKYSSQLQIVQNAAARV